MSEIIDNENIDSEINIPRSTSIDSSENIKFKDTIFNTGKPSIYNVIFKTNEQINDKIFSSSNNVSPRSESKDELNTMSSSLVTGLNNDLKEIINNNKQETLERKTSLYKRMFGKINEGSLRGSIFSLVTTALGSGCLALPYAMNKMGIIVTTIAIIFTSMCVLMNFYFIAKVSSKKKIYDYAELCDKVLGRKVKYIVNYGFIVYLFGSLIAYQVLLYRLIATIYYDFFEDHDKTSLRKFLNDGLFKRYEYEWPINIAFGLLVLFPLCLYRSLKDFRIPSMIGTLATVILMLVNNINYIINIFIFRY